MYKMTFPEFFQQFLSRKNPAIRYVDKLVSTLFEAALLITASGILYALICYILNMLWFLYLETPMGNRFIALYPEQAATIRELTELDLVYFCAEVTLSTFVICFTISVVCRFLHISHYFYHSQGLFGKLMYWGIPLTAAVAYYIKNEYGFYDWKVTGFIVMIPTYLIFISCFKYSEKLIPEAGDLLSIIIMWIRAWLRIWIKKLS